MILWLHTFWAIIFSVYSEQSDLMWTTVPSTPYCYHYNKTECDTAKSNASMPSSERSMYCSMRKVECVAMLDGHAACISIWKQNSNESLPDHTDTSFENTVYMSCFKSNSMDQTFCTSDCIATSVGYRGNENETSLVSCCCTEPLCNHPETRILNLTDMVQQKGPSVSNSRYPTQLYYGLGIAGGILFVGTLSLIATMIFIRHKVSRLKQGENHVSLEECDAQENSSLLLDHLSPQGDIAQGRYAKVVLGGEVNGVRVVIKSFTAANRKMWQQERDIYCLPGMTGNSNIARFFGATHTGTGNEMNMWIVLQYYPNGSIYDYLKGHILTWPEMLKLSHSMMKGLAYLHEEFILPDEQRRSLAHRDIKSKNVLIKDDMTAAIADFGLAQCFTDGNVNESHAQFQAGTHRYMAPEVLDGAISFTKDSFLRIDVYAAALVMWELLTRCEVSEDASLEYKAPYENMESSHLSLLENLQIVVSKEKKRPAFPSCLYRDRHAVTLVTTIEESWDADAEARLSAGCVEARLRTLLAISASGDTEENNRRNHDPPPYSPLDPSAEISSPLIPYNHSV